MSCRWTLLTRIPHEHCVDFLIIFAFQEVPVGDGAFAVVGIVAPGAVVAPVFKWVVIGIKVDRSAYVQSDTDPATQPQNGGEAG